MTKDGLKDVESLFSDMKNDGVGANYLKMAQSVSFSKFATYTVELPLSEYWRPEVKVTKRAEIKNLQDYKTFMEVRMKVKPQSEVDG